MKLEQRFKPVRWVCACLLATAAFSPPLLAVDKGMYDGEWRSQSPALSLKITPQDAHFTIDGKTYTDTTPEYFNGQLATAPFLYLQADDATDKQRHRLYLMVSDASKLNGYYDYADQSLPITLTH